MCGIAGFTYAGGAFDCQAVAEDMLSAIAYRGPDEKGVVVLDELVLAHNRLTIMEPQGGQQPRLNVANGNALIYNGEIYAHRKFDAELQAAGCDLRDHCDTETLFWLLEEYGVTQTVSMVDGMFAFAWYHARSDTLHLVRDRFGQKPLFFAQRGDDLIFASEIKALRRHPALQTVVADLDALRLYLLMEYVPGRATGLKDVQQLPAGHILTWHNGDKQIRPYWQPADVSRNRTASPAAAVDELDRILDAAVQQQLVADVPVGVFLSGGLDSSLVAAMSRKHHHDIATFTVKFPYASFDESGFAADVAQSLGTRHRTIELGRQACLDGMELLLERADQPFSDSSSLPSYLLCEATKQHVTVALGGDGADELFFGYPNFRLMKLASLMAVLPRPTGKLVRGLANILPGSGGYMSRNFLLRQLSYGFGQPAHLQSILWMSAVSPERQRSLWIDGIAGSPQLVRDPELTLLEQCQRHFLESYLACDILQKMDRAAMHVSLEVRSPFLSAAVSEFALQLPVAESFYRSQGKRILRAVAAKYLDHATINRPKHGFALPVSELLRGDLRDLAEPILLDGANPMYEHIRRDAVSALWSSHVNDARDHGKSLWALLMMAAFFRNHF